MTSQRSAKRHEADPSDTLREKIVRWVFPPGMALSEVKLAARFRVSRAAIRQALRTLIKEDLARYLPGRGIFVSEIAIPEFIELFHMRGALEPYCARLAARAVAGGSPAKLQDIRAAIARSAGRGGKGEDYPRLSARLDERLMTLAGNMRLAAALREVRAQLARTKRLTFTNRNLLRESATQQLAVIDAVAQGDEDRAFRFASQHVQGGFEVTLQMVRQRAASRRAVRR